LRYVRVAGATAATPIVTSSQRSFSIFSFKELCWLLFVPTLLSSLG
jgi:hypothetical protein